ncbi:MAG TPA: hypothetical protein DCP06_06460 [Lachnospiraceae bacterium]|nr:hypothetical protein [Lachnospiraceae bacterium]
MAMDENIKKQLVEQLGAELGVKKESKDVRFDSSTGTLYGAELRNYAVSHIDSDQFTKGKTYEGGDIVNGRIRVIDDNNRPSNIHLSDYDFEFHLHVAKQ